MTNPVGQKLLNNYTSSIVAVKRRQADTQRGKEVLSNLHPASTVAEQERPWRERCH